MPKRANPYFHDFQPQVKIHVGIKQLYNTEDKMKSVYDKTIGLLFEAANQKNNNISGLKSIAPSKESVNGCQTKAWKQMYLGKNGALQKDGGHVQISETQKPCGVCTSQSADPWMCCGYCEMPQCASCSLQCSQCQSYTCSNCSIDSYSNHIGVSCLSCCR